MVARTHFEGAPREITSQLVVLDPSNHRTLTALVLSCSSLYGAYIGDKLLMDVVCGKIKTVNNILENHPLLLFYSGTVTDYSGFTLHGVTPLDIAFGYKHLPMCEMMLPILDRIENGRERAFVQLSKNFPESVTSRIYDFSVLVQAVRTRTNYNEALAKFLEDFQPGVIKIGERSNIQIFIQALNECKTINESDIGFFRANQIRRSFFWRFVVGHLELNLTPYYAESICKGVKNILNKAAILTGNFEYDAYEVFFPIDEKLNRLGKDFAVIGMKNGTEKGITTVCAYNYEITCFANSLLMLHQQTEAGLANFRDALQRINENDEQSNVEQINDPPSSCNIS